MHLPLCSCTALYLALGLLVGCVNYFPIHEVWIHNDTKLTERVQMVEEVVLSNGFERCANRGDAEVLTQKGKVYFISSFCSQHFLKVHVFVRRSGDGKMLQVRLEDSAVGGFQWQPKVLDLAKKIEADLRQKFPFEQIWIPVDLSQARVR